MRTTATPANNAVAGDRGDDDDVAGGGHEVGTTAVDDLRRDTTRARSIGGSEMCTCVYVNIGGLLCFLPLVFGLNFGILVVWRSLRIRTCNELELQGKAQKNSSARVIIGP